jgi:hypothetical protein
MRRIRYTVKYRKATKDWALMSGVCLITASRTKASAIDLGRHYARSRWRRGQPSQLVIRTKDGRIQTEHTYGRDPKRHKG